MTTMSGITVDSFHRETGMSLFFYFIPFFHPKGVFGSAIPPFPAASLCVLRVTRVSCSNVVVLPCPFGHCFACSENIMPACVCRVMARHVTAGPSQPGDLRDATDPPGPLREEFPGGPSVHFSRHVLPENHIYYISGGLS